MFDMNQTCMARNNDGESPSFWEHVLTKIRRAGLRIQFIFCVSFSTKITRNHASEFSNENHENS